MTPLPFKTPAEFRRWLERNHAASTGVWLRLFKKASGEKSVTYAEALDQALCYGWIDGQVKPLDSLSWLRKFTPRRPKSGWSKINTQHAERLIQSGAMTPAGLAAIAAAKADGRWEAAYAGQAGMEVPDDLTTALRANPRAREMFETLSSANRYAILYRIGNAKKPETRSRRIDQFVEMLGRGETIHPQAP